MHVSLSSLLPSWCVALIYAWIPSLSLKELWVTCYLCNCSIKHLIERGSRSLKLAWIWTVVSDTRLLLYVPYSQWVFKIISLCWCMQHLNSYWFQTHFHLNVWISPTTIWCCYSICHLSIGHLRKSFKKNMTWSHFRSHYYWMQPAYVVMYISNAHKFVSMLICSTSTAMALFKEQINTALLCLPIS